MLLKKNQLTILYVYYSRYELLIQAVKSVPALFINTNLIVVNNNKRQRIGRKIKRIFPGVKYIEAPSNLGYAKGNNLGAEYAKSEYILIANPDTLPAPGAIENLVKFLDKHKEAAIVAPNLKYPNGKLIEDQGTKILTPLRGIFALSFLNKVFPNNPVSKKYLLRNLSKRKIREVDVVPGSAFMIRRKVFEKLGGFDSNFFLYFEEFDLCKRVREVGWKVYMIPSATFVHDWKPGEGGEKLKSHYLKSKFYYFNKHFGFINAVLVEVFTRISKFGIFAFLTVGLSLFLRFWKLPETMSFIGDFGWYYLEAKRVITENYYPLVGIPSSVPILKQGAIWTYVLAMFLKIGNFNPVSGAVAGALFGSIGVLFTLIITKRYWSGKLSVVAGLLAATSPFIVFHDRIPFQTTLMFPFTVLFFYLMLLFTKQRGRKIPFLLGLMFGILIQIELVALIFIPVFASYLYIISYKPNRYQLLALLTGIYFGISPFFLYDFQNGVFIQTVGLFIWFFTKFIENIWALVFGIAFLGAFKVLLKRFGYFTSQSKLVILWFLIGSGAFLMRGVYSEAYLPTIYFPILLVISSVFLFFIKKIKFIGVFIFTFLLIINIYAFIEAVNSQKIKKDSILTQLAVAERIVEDSDREHFNFKYIGPGMEFHSGESNWEYIFWWKGANLDRSKIPQYLIMNKPYSYQRGYNDLAEYGDYKITKKN